MKHFLLIIGLRDGEKIVCVCERESARERERDREIEGSCEEKDYAAGKDKKGDR